MQVSRDGGIACSLFEDDTPAIMSPAYYIFEVYNRDVLPEYLQLVFCNPEFDREAVFMAVGGVRGTLTWDDFINLQIDVPSLEEQEKLVCKVFQLKERSSTLIDLISKLSSVAQIQFQNNFGYKCFDDSCPEGWKKGKLSELLMNVKDAISPDEVGELPYLPIDFMPKNKLITNIFCSNTEANSSLVRFKENDILMGAMRVYFHRVLLSLVDGITRSTSFVLRVKNNEYLFFALLLCNTNYAISYASNHSQGTTMPYAVWEDGLGDMEINIPPESELISFNSKISPIFESIKIYDQELVKIEKINSLLSQNAL